MGLGYLLHLQKGSTRKPHWVRRVNVYIYSTVVDTELKIRGGGGGGGWREGGGHADTEIRRAGAVFKKFFFRPFSPMFGRKIRGGGGGRPPPLDSPVLYTVQNAYRLSLRPNINSVG